jgi:hypothetical protein
MSDTVSVKSNKAQMPHITMKRILSGPTLSQLKQLKPKLTTNLLAVPCPWGCNKGHLGLLQDLVLYLQCNRAAYTIPVAAPLGYPVFVAGATTSKCKELHINNISTQKAWAMYMIVHTIMHYQFCGSH